MNDSQRLKSEFFVKLYDDQFSKLQIKRFYLQSRKIYVEQDMAKDKIIKLFKIIMTAKKMVDENVRVDKATVLSSKEMFQMNG